MKKKKKKKQDLIKSKIRSFHSTENFDTSWLEKKKEKRYT